MCCFGLVVCSCEAVFQSRIVRMSSMKRVFLQHAQSDLCAPQAWELLREAKHDSHCCHYRKPGLGNGVNNWQRAALRCAGTGRRLMCLHVE